MIHLPADSETAAAPAQPATPLPLRVDFSDGPAALARFACSDAGPGTIRIGCGYLAGPERPECWYAGADYRFVAIEVPESDGDIAAAARHAYAALIARARGTTHPFLLRIWNYFGDINAGEGDCERYRRFCVGRAAAVDAAFNAPPPAATAIGHSGRANTLQVIALSSSAPGIALENPRQTPAWSYPRDYGPVAPGFSRGALLEADSAAPRLLASGTASIVGHVSEHVGNVREQLLESLRNLEALLAVGGERGGRAFALAGCEALRVYLRRPADLALAREAIAGTALPGDRVLYLHGDVCRRELDVELEGVFAAARQGPQDFS